MVPKMIMFMVQKTVALTILHCTSPVG